MKGGGGSCLAAVEEEEAQWRSDGGGEDGDGERTAAPLPLLPKEVAGNPERLTAKKLNAFYR